MDPKSFCPISLSFFILKTFEKLLMSYVGERALQWYSIIFQVIFSELFMSNLILRIGIEPNVTKYQESMIPQYHWNRKYCRV